MIRLLKIELKKLVNNKTFWILLGLYALILASVFWSIQTVVNDIVKETGKSIPIPVSKISLYTFPDIWHNLTFVSGYLKLILAIIVIIFITNEYSYRTIRQNIITGLSRLDFLLSKLLMVGVIALGATLFLYINGLILGFLNTTELTFSMIFQKNIFLFAYFLELFAFMTLALMIGILVKRSGFALGLLALYYYIVEPILNYKLPYDIGEYLPIKAIANLIDVPNTSLMKLVGLNFREYISVSDTLITIAYTCLFTYLMFLVLRKRDL